MSMDALQKAAEAAGYAMAFAEDEPIEDRAPQSRALVLMQHPVDRAPPVAGSSASDAIASASSWVRAYLPGYFGGRAPA